MGTSWLLLMTNRVLSNRFGVAPAGWTLRKIAGELNRLGVATKNGGAAWYASTVRRIVTNKLYMVAA